MKNTVVVLGAGMVGVACALELQRRGMVVTLVDRDAPGRRASYGNAGVLARSSLMPFNNPGLWASLPKLLRNQTTQFRYSPSFLLRNVGWVARFLACARPSVFEDTKAALNALIALSIGEQKRLMDEAGAAHRWRDNGWLFLYRSHAAYAAGQRARDAFEQFGIATQELDRRALSDLEPCLSPVFDRALWIRDTASVDNPGAVVQSYSDLFCRRGGTLLRREIVSLHRAVTGWQVLDRTGERLSAERVVVALGAWTKQFLATLGIRVPMAFERGYHMHYARDGGDALGRPIYDVEGGYVLSPMEQGLRLTTGVELADLEAPENLTQLRRAEEAAREALPLGKRLDGDAWLGHRPTLPDSRPIIGETPRHPGLWLAFGHQHIGFSTGPGTAIVLGALMSGEAPRIDSSPFRPTRFIR